MKNFFIVLFIAASFSSSTEELKTENLGELLQLPISDESSGRIYLVRHGESTANVYFELDGKKVRYVSGQALSVPLTETGKTQIRELGKMLAGRFPKQAPLIITSSSALRTQQTAKILFEELSKSHSNVVLTEEVYPGLNERSLGQWEGELRDEKYTAAEAPWKALSALDKYSTPEIPCGESNAEVANRAVLAIADIYYRYQKGTIIAVTSFNTINATTIKLNHIELSSVIGSDLPKLDLNNGNLVLFETPRNCGFGGLKAVSHIKL